MADRENVIKGLECCNKPNNHDDCPYNGECHYNVCTHKLLDDALELLKEQETMRQCKDCKFYAGTHPEFAMCSELDICVDSDFYCKYWRTEGR